MRPQEISFRTRQIGRLWRVEGAKGLSHRLRLRLATKLAPPGSARLAIGDEEFAAEARMARSGSVLPGPAPRLPGEPLKVAWITDPPAPGSGGHTTMFRLIEALRRAGHTSTVYLVDRHGWDLTQHRKRIRRGWPHVEVEVKDFDDGVSDAHALFATGWESAWTTLRTQALGLRCYLVQDFEPLFHPAGSQSLLAEATYRFGFAGVTAGRWLPELLAERFSMDAVGFDFGVDTDTYRLTNDGDRPAVCYYCRPSSPRRGHELAVATLRRFAERNPQVTIHLYGERVGDLRFDAVQHGILAPQRLSELYNRCAAGLVLSATNVSLVPHEMLAAGCIPVVNDADHNRLVLANDHVAYAAATPYHLGKALERVVRQPTAELIAGARVAAAGVGSSSWETIGDDFVQIIDSLVDRALSDSAK